MDEHVARLQDALEHEKAKVSRLKNPFTLLNQEMCEYTVDPPTHTVLHT